jgi:hypothetical protein
MATNAFPPNFKILPRSGMTVVSVTLTFENLNELRHFNDSSESYQEPVEIRGSLSESWKAPVDYAQSQFY